jgi:hypothetical protein
MPFREKSAWISMLSMLAIYGFYFGTLMQTTAARQPGNLASGITLVQTIVMLVVAQVALHIAVAIRKPAEAQLPRDEREKLIDLKATRIAFYGLASGVVVACLFGSLNPPVFFSTNSLLLILVTSEIVRSGAQIIYYRLGA